MKREEASVALYECGYAILPGPRSSLRALILCAHSLGIGERATPTFELLLGFVARSWYRT